MIENQRPIWLLVVLKTRDFNPERSGQHYTIRGGCQMLPENIEAKCDLYPISGFGENMAGIGSMTKERTGVKFRICAPQQLQIQKGEHRSLCSSFVSWWWFCAVDRECSLSLAASAQGRQDSTIRIKDNMMLAGFTSVKIIKVLL